jgi:hypothetical protein
MQHILALQVFRLEDKVDIPLSSVFGRGFLNKRKNGEVSCQYPQTLYFPPYVVFFILPMYMVGLSYLISSFSL